MRIIDTPYNLIVILGPTASGKTSVAARLAKEIGGEVISADSRQVYEGLDLGTGKDYGDYIVDGTPVLYHLIDIKPPGYQYNVYEFQNDFVRVFEKLQKENTWPVFCGGSGLYIEAAIQGYRMVQVPVNEELRKKLEPKSLSELTEILAGYHSLHNTTDVDTYKRAVRAIEIAEYYRLNNPPDDFYPEIKPLLVGVRFPRNVERERITARLKQRLESGMMQEVEGLLQQGLTPDQLLYYGLEYKYLTLYLIGKLTYDEMFCQLNTAIHQFAKRQMTWFRRMERNGMNIHWLEGQLPMEEKISLILKWLTGDEYHPQTIK